MNDKLITYENLGRFYDDLVGNDIAELAIKISNLIKDTSTSNDSTWSSNKLNTTFATKQELNTKQNVLTEGTHIDITNNVISVEYEIATTADIEALFSPAPAAPADNEIWYTTESGELWEPYDMYGGGDTLQIDGNTLLSNTYQDGHGVLRYANDITILEQPWGKTDYDHTTDLISITLPHSVNYIGDILKGNSGLNTVYYNGTVAECSEIDMGNFATYADFDINHQIICLDGIYDMWG